MMRCGELLRGRLSVAAVAGGVLALSGCKVDTDPHNFAGDTSETGPTGSSGEGESESGEEGESGNCPDDGCLDISLEDEGEVPCEEEGGTAGCECEAPPHTPCDDGEADLLNALGLNCPGELQYNVESWGSSMAFGTLTNFGDTDAYAAREGVRFATFGAVALAGESVCYLAGASVGISAFADESPQSFADRIVEATRARRRYVRLALRVTASAALLALGVAHF